MCLLVAGNCTLNTSAPDGRVRAALHPDLEETSEEAACVCACTRDY